MLCAKCRQSNPAQARFCNQCGAALVATAAPELRRLTVMFCDLAGSVELASRLDPEDWHALLGAYQATAGGAIRQHHGYIAQHLGDGLVAYFGYPVAGEDDAVRAVLAGLEVVREVSRLAIPGGGHLRVRVGVHTGPTFMGHVAGDQGEYLAMGETPNLAARIQSAAVPNTVVLSQATRTLVDARLQCADLGDHQAKGLAAPLRLYQALGLRSRDGDGLAATRDPVPFLGRSQELARLAAVWNESGGASGRCVLLRGEPGIGKSRLSRQVRARAAQDGAETLLMRSSAHTANTPFAPLAQFLRGAMAATGLPDDSAASLAAVLGAAGITDEAVVGPLREMLALATSGTAEEPAVSAQAMRERTFAAASAVLRTLAARSRVLLIVEDLHWSDPSTLEWIGRLLRRDLPGGLMLLLLARPEFDPRWAASPRVEAIALEPCTAEDAAAMVAALDPQNALGRGAVARIVERAEGNPLFVEEFTRSALEALGEDIPLTLQEQTMARLDRLGAAKQVLQQAAIIGRHFTLRQLCAVSGLAEAAVRDALKRGVDAHMLRPLAGGEQFAFHHALLRDAAYSSLLRSARQGGHARVAAALLAEDATITGRQPELLAHHYSEAGQREQAVDHWVAAARLALLRSASVEATAHARTALRLLGEPGDDEAALATELELQLVLAPALMATRGILDPQVEQTYARARQLCARLGDANRLLVPLWGLWAYELMRGEVDASWEATRQLQVLADAGQLPVAPLVVAATGGMTLFYRGDLQAARAECAKGLGQVRLPASADRSVRGFHDPGVMCLAFHNLASWLLGDAATARAGAATLREMIPTLAPFDAAYACCADAVLHTLAGDAPAACGASARAMAVSKEQAFPAWLMMGSLMDGWGRARQGGGAAAIAQMRASFDAWCASGARNLRPFFLGLLADALLVTGDPDQALQCAQAGLAEAATGEHWWDPELHRLRAEALALRGEHAAALQGARLAHELAVAADAQAWARRAEATLARLAQRDEAAA